MSDPKAAALAGEIEAIRARLAAARDDSHGATLTALARSIRELELRISLRAIRNVATIPPDTPSSPSRARRLKAQ